MTMKKSSVMMIALTVMLSSCGTFTQLITSSEGQKFQDGIYSSTPSFRSKEEKQQSRTEAEALVAKTKESPVYLFEDKKEDTVPAENQSVTINISPSAYYAPFSIGSAWYWSRHYDPWYSMTWSFHNPWYRYRWHDPWYWGGWHDTWYWNRWMDPWYLDRWYDPWYWGGWYDPWYYGGYWGHHHKPGHIGGGHGGGHGRVQRVYVPRHRTQDNEKVTGTSSLERRTTTVRRGTGTSSSVSRNSSTNYRRPSDSPTRRSSAYNSDNSQSRSSSSSYERSSSSSQSRSSSSSYNRSSSSSYNRSSSGSSYSGGSRSSGGGYSGGGGSRSSSSSSSSRR